MIPLPPLSHQNLEEQRRKMSPFWPTEGFWMRSFDPGLPRHTLDSSDAECLGRTQPAVSAERASRGGTTNCRKGWNVVAPLELDLPV